MPRNIVTLLCRCDRFFSLDWWILFFQVCDAHLKTALLSLIALEMQTIGSPKTRHVVICVIDPYFIYFFPIQFFVWLVLLPLILGRQIHKSRYMATGLLISASILLCFMTNTWCVLTFLREYYLISSINLPWKHCSCLTLSSRFFFLKNQVPCLEWPWQHLHLQYIQQACENHLCWGSRWCCG